MRESVFFRFDAFDGGVSYLRHNLIRARTNSTRVLLSQNGLKSMLAINACSRNSNSVAGSVRMFTAACVLICLAILVVSIQS
jgi:hypothetical protein